MNLETRSLHVVGLGGTLREDSNSLRALNVALWAAENAGATTDLLDLHALDLPMYRPGRTLADFPPQVADYIDRIRQADAMLWSTAAYHGSLAGATKNAIDFMEFLSGGEHPYLDRKVIGLIATAGGAQGGVNAVNALAMSVQSLRGTAAPLVVPIPGAGKMFDAAGNLTDAGIADKLTKLGGLVVEMAALLHPHRTLQASESPVMLGSPNR